MNINLNIPTFLEYDILLVKYVSKNEKNEKIIINAIALECTPKDKIKKVYAIIFSLEYFQKIKKLKNKIIDKKLLDVFKKPAKKNLSKKTKNRKTHKFRLTLMFLKINKRGKIKTIGNQ